MGNPNLKVTLTTRVKFCFCFSLFSLGNLLLDLQWPDCEKFVAYFFNFFFSFNFFFFFQRVWNYFLKLKLKLTRSKNEIGTNLKTRWMKVHLKKLFFTSRANITIANDFFSPEKIFATHCAWLR